MKKCRLKSAAGALQPVPALARFRPDSMPPLSAETVGARLKDPTSRARALAELEQHEGPHARALAIAASPALSHIVGDEVDAATFRRAALLRARLLEEAPDSPSSVWGPMFGDGRMVAEFDAPSNVTARALQKAAAELGAEDAMCFACQHAYWAPSFTRGMQSPVTAAGFAGTRDYTVLMMGKHPLISKQKQPTDDVHLKLCGLMLELLRSPEAMPPLVINGAAWTVFTCALARPTVGKVLVQQSGICEVVVAQLRAMGSPADWQVRFIASDCHSAAANQSAAAGTGSGESDSHSARECRADPVSWQRWPGWESALNGDCLLQGLCHRSRACGQKRDRLLRPV